jgi:hypothetical protein
MEAQCFQLILCLYSGFFAGESGIIIEQEISAILG